MKKEPPYEIGQYLKHHSGIVIELERYDTQLVRSQYLSVGGGSVKRVSNYNYLYGVELETNRSFEGKTSKFELFKN